MPQTIGGRWQLNSISHGTGWLEVTSGEFKGKRLGDYVMTDSRYTGESYLQMDRFGNVFNLRLKFDTEETISSIGLTAYRHLYLRAEWRSLYDQYDGKFTLEDEGSSFKMVDANPPSFTTNFNCQIEQITPDYLLMSISFDDKLTRYPYGADITAHRTLKAQFTRVY